MCEGDDKPTAATKRTGQERKQRPRKPLPRGRTGREVLATTVVGSDCRTAPTGGMQTVLVHAAVDGGACGWVKRVWGEEGGCGVGVRQATIAVC
jgi:hypothetical protein